MKDNEDDYVVISKNGLSLVNAGPISMLEAEAFDGYTIDSNQTSRLEREASCNQTDE